MTLDWLDIAAHTAVAVLVALGMGIGAAAGVSYGGFSGWALVALCLAGNAANALFWPIREREQHGHEWGGLQSHLEWMFPSGAAWITFGAVLVL